MQKCEIIHARCESGIVPLFVGSWFVLGWPLPVDAVAELCIIIITNVVRNCQEHPTFACHKHQR
jgi:hypothetical protein